MHRPESKLGRELVLAAVELLGRAGRDATVRVQGDSMRPTLRPGQLLAVEFSAERLAVGDLLLFRQGDSLLVHRLLGDARPLDGHRRLRTRGDGVATLDPAVDLDRVVGRVTAIEDSGRWLSTTMGPAGAYARCLAWHNRLWAAAFAVAYYPERALGRVRVTLRLRAAVAALDRALLQLTHRVLFRRLHREVPRPETGD
jgi:hypothetical protein